MNIGNIIKVISAALGGVASFLFGQLTGLFFALIIFIILDYITGVAAAIKNNELDSRTGAFGILKKVGILSVIILVNVLDVHVFGASGVLRNVIISFYIANEGISVLENAARLGVPVPKRIINVLNQLKDKAEEEENKKDEK